MLCSGAESSADAQTDAPADAAITQPDGVADYVLAADAEANAEAGDSAVGPRVPHAPGRSTPGAPLPFFDLSPRN